MIYLIFSINYLILLIKYIFDYQIAKQKKI